MPTPNEVYNSNNVPFAGMFIQFYRDQSAPTLLGIYLMESSTPTDQAVVVDRPHLDGGDNGWVLVKGKTEGPAKFQQATAATPTLRNGDMFKTTKFSNDASSVGEARYFAIMNIAYSIEANGYRSYSCTIREDKYSTIAMQTNIIEYGA